MLSCNNICKNSTQTTTLLNLENDFKSTGIKVKVSAPGKVILHGEHSVVYGKLALAASLGLRTSVQLIELKSNEPNPQITFNLKAVNTVYSYKFQEIVKLLNDVLPITTEISQFNYQSPELLNYSEVLIKVERFIKENQQKYDLNNSQYIALLSLLYLLTGILSSIDIKFINPFILIADTNLTISAGTGSSASLLVSTAGTLIQYLKIKGCSAENISKSGYKNSKFENVNLKIFSDFEKDLISRWAFCAEKIVHGIPSGIDNTICTFGSLVEFYKGSAPKVKLLKKSLKIMLVDTKVPKDTKILVMKVANLYKKHKLIVDNILNSMDNISLSALDNLIQISETDKSPLSDINKYFSNLEELSDLNHHLLCSLGVSHPKIDEVISILSSNQLHGKITGSGGGGYVFCYIAPYIEEATIETVTSILTAKGFRAIVTELGDVGVRID